MARRILAVWFLRLAAERVTRQQGHLLASPQAVVQDVGNRQTLASLTTEAEACGLHTGQPLRDALAMCPNLRTHTANPAAERAFLTSLRRWAGKFTPWVAELPPDGLTLDITGCAHLFGGEAALSAQIAQECADMGLSLRHGLADTPGAAWALARFATAQIPAMRSGDAIDQEARATRARAGKRRHWERGGTAPQTTLGGAQTLGQIAAPGQTQAALAGLPLTALRLDVDTVAGLARLGIVRVDDLLGLPRAALARRFGRAVLWRLDQALGREPEPVAPARAPLHFGVRMTFAQPIGTPDDISAALSRLVDRLCTKLQAAARGARRLRVQIFRSDHTQQEFDLGLARASATPDSIAPLVLLKRPLVDPGFGIEVIRLEAYHTEPTQDGSHLGQIFATEQAIHTQLGAASAKSTTDPTSPALADLIGRLGARLGPEMVMRLHPADSHIPEKTAQFHMAAWSEPAPNWPTTHHDRPLLLFAPEPITPTTQKPTPQIAHPPAQFLWRRRNMAVVGTRGPERIAPEWWLDDPAWRSGPRDYWQVETVCGAKLWLFQAHGGTLSGGWFCHGSFA